MDKNLLPRVERIFDQPTINTLTYANAFDQRLRRDRFYIKGSVKQTYRLDDGRRVERVNSLCAEAVCFRFLKVSGLSQIIISALDPVTYPDSKEFREVFHGVTDRLGVSLLRLIRNNRGFSDFAKIRGFPKKFGAV